MTRRKKHALPVLRGLKILYEDRDVVVVNKNPGVLSCSTRAHDEFTAENVLSDYLRKGDSKSRNQAYLVHRLDRDTSGIMVFAKSAEMQRRLVDNWANAEKLYIVAVYGHLAQPAGVLSGYLAQDENLLVHAVRDPGRGHYAETEYAVVGETATVTILKVRLRTGRRNQIRVQFKDHGLPVVGDVKYNWKDPFRERLCLHAKSLAFDHPYDGRRCAFETDIPEVFRQVARGLREADWQKA